MTALQITEDNFPIIIETYRLEKETNEFDGFWDPYAVKDVDGLRNEIEKMGNSFWGDHIMIQLLEKALNINIILLSCENDFFSEKINTEFKALEIILIKKEEQLYYLTV